MSNRIEVSKGSASSLGSNGIISYKIDSIEDTLKVGLALSLIHI